MRSTRSLLTVVLASTLVTGVFFSTGTHAVANHPEPLQPIHQLNVDKYMGTWFEMASIPQRFQNACARDTHATYALINPTTVSVTNTCTHADGVESSMKGKAVITDTTTNAQLRVEFFTEPNPADTPNYVVTYIDEAYSLAIVGNPTRSSGWILSKNPTMTSTQWDTAKKIVAERGFRYSDFVVTPQSQS